ncbi:MAG TPA: MogA/MoaB family molybdenum cofactor biosynthesis protein [Dehalococcoidia bacterium]|nr:MogA/MoaB family molybdenum cofactor biosynthesis protein [Dehalococcoidia bacterium]
MSHLEHKELSPKAITCNVLIISDSRTEKTDESGKYLVENLKGCGHTVVDFAFLKNDQEAIKNKLKEYLAQEELQVIITSGGTGVSMRDVTVETVTPMLDKMLDGFGELFRTLSYTEIGTASIMSRAIAGVISGKVIVCVPGSLAAVKLALDKIILPEIGHMVREATR